MKNSIFLDTSFAFELINKSDDWYKVAVELEERLNVQEVYLITTEYVLLEIANGLSSINYRNRSSHLINVLLKSSFVKIVFIGEELFKEGLRMYEYYLDKDYSLTDCISFIVMKENNLNESLTSDHHFEQMGFQILMKNS